MAWIQLLIAGLLEIGWAIGIKYTHGFTRLWPSLFTIMAMVLSVFLLSLSIKHIPLSTAYTIWVGIGAFGTAIFGIYLFDESTHILRILSLLLIIVGVAGLKVTSPG